MSRDSHRGCHLLLHCPLEVNCLDTCYPRLKAACGRVEQPSGGAAVSAGGLASIMGTIWLCFPACTAFPVLCSQEAQGKSSSPPNYSLVNGRWTRNSGEKDFNLFKFKKKNYFKIHFFFFLVSPCDTWDLKFPDHVSNLCPLQWKCRVLTTGLLGMTLVWFYKK